MSATQTRPYAIKMRHPGAKRYLFYAHTRALGVSRLRIHATQFDKDRAQDVMAQLARFNPSITEWKVVKL